MAAFVKIGSLVSPAHTIYRWVINERKKLNKRSEMKTKKERSIEAVLVAHGGKTPY